MKNITKTKQMEKFEIIASFEEAVSLKSGIQKYSSNDNKPDSIKEWNGKVCLGLEHQYFGGSRYSHTCILIADGCELLRNGEGFSWVPQGAKLVKCGSELLQIGCLTS